MSFATVDSFKLSSLEETWLVHIESLKFYLSGWYQVMIYPGRSILGDS